MRDFGFEFIFRRNLIMHFLVFVCLGLLFIYSPLALQTPLGWLLNVTGISLDLKLPFSKRLEVRLNQQTLSKTMFS